MDVISFLLLQYKSAPRGAPRLKPGSELSAVN